MPQVVPTYKCCTCGAIFNKEPDAIKCEAEHVTDLGNPTFEFRQIHMYPSIVRFQATDRETGHPVSVQYTIDPGQPKWVGDPPPTKR